MFRIFGITFLAIACMTPLIVVALPAIVIWLCAIHDQRAAAQRAAIRWDGPDPRRFEKARRKALASF